MVSNHTISSRSILCLIILALVACSGASDDATPTNSGGTASSPVAGGDRASGLLYLRGHTLHSVDLESGEDEVLGDVPATDVHASPDGRLLAYVIAGSTQPEGEDFIVDPELHLFSPATEEDTFVGSGVGPLWHPDGDRFAYLEPTSKRECEGETCVGQSAVVVAEVGSEQRRTFLEAGGWILLGWLGDRLLVADPQEASLLQVDETGAETTDVQPGELWGASPDGRWLVTVVPQGLRMEAPDGAGDAREVGLEGRRPGEGSWSPTSDRLAVVLLSPAGQVRGSELALVEPSGRVTIVPDSEGASGPVLWSPEGDALVFARSTGAKGLRLEAVLCRLASLDCRPLFSWATGVSLLALTGS